MTALRSIRLSGELDIARRMEIDSALRLQPDDRGIILDFSDVTYADSTAFSSMMRLSREAREARVPLVLLATTKQFHRLIEYAGVGEVIPVFADRSEALSFLAEHYG